MQGEANTEPPSELPCQPSGVLCGGTAISSRLSALQAFPRAGNVPGSS